ncbi:MAG: SDR family NAD(P)-dependent oxidoreductase [archaeon]|nr:SDR family NAD(P)-dependent oxidoreductase [archaeon]
MQTILIVGTSTGIGEACVKLLSEKNFKVIATTRDPSKAEHLAKLPNVTVIKLDILDYESVKTTCDQLKKDHEIDIVYSNAGIGMTVPVELETVEEVKKLFDLNFFATVNVLKQFITYFKEKKKGMFMVTSSLASVMSISLQSAYGSSKRALNSFCESLYYELKPYNIPVKIILPAYTITAFKYLVMNLGEYKQSYKKQGKFLSNGGTYAAKPEETAACVLEAITDGKDQIHYPADIQAKKLIDDYNQMGLEKFKTMLCELMFKDGV